MENNTVRTNMIAKIINKKTVTNKLGKVDYYKINSFLNITSEIKELFLKTMLFTWDKEKYFYLINHHDHEFICQVKCIL